MHQKQRIMTSLLSWVTFLFAVSLHAADVAPPAAPLWEGEVASVVSQTGVKWHPGHYMRAFEGDPQSAWDMISSEPNIKGVQIQYRWAALEKGKDVYDFSQIESDLAYLQARGKRLVIKFDDRDFGETNVSKVVPDYLTNDPTYRGGAAPTKNGWIAKIWIPEVMDREIKLLQALGRRFDSEPFVEMITTQETAPGFAGNVPSDYSGAAFEAQLARMNAALRAAFPNTVCMQGMNHFNSQGGGGSMEGVLINSYQVGCGGISPDFRIVSQTSAQKIFNANHVDKMPHANTVSASTLSGTGSEPPHTPDELIKQALQVEKLNYMFWVRSAFTKHDALRAIEANNAAINTKCPENLSCKTN